MLAGNVAMLALAATTMLAHNGGCWWGATDACLSGWPSHPVAPAVHWYYSAELAWYLHLLLKPVLKYGVPDGRDMVLHHCATLALVFASFGFNLTRIGVLVLALFAVSNPLLHAAKIVNQLGLAPLRTPAFGAFALAFFVTRVVMVPRVVLKPAVLDSRTLIPHAVADFPVLYAAISGLLAALYVLNLSWMWGIARWAEPLRRAAAGAAVHAQSVSGWRPDRCPACPPPPTARAGSCGRRPRRAARRRPASPPSSTPPSATAACSRRHQRRAGGPLRRPWALWTPPPELHNVP